MSNDLDRKGAHILDFLVAFAFGFSAALGLIGFVVWLAKRRMAEIEARLMTLSLNRITKIDTDERIRLVDDLTDHEFFEDTTYPIVPDNE